MVSFFKKLYSSWLWYCTACYITNWGAESHFYTHCILSFLLFKKGRGNGNGGELFFSLLYASCHDIACFVTDREAVFDARSHTIHTRCILLGWGGGGNEGYFSLFGIACFITDREAVFDAWSQLFIHVAFCSGFDNKKGGRVEWGWWAHPHRCMFYYRPSLPVFFYMHDHTLSIHVAFCCDGVVVVVEDCFSIFFNLISILAWNSVFYYRSGHSFDAWSQLFIHIAFCIGYVSKSDMIE
jgi:hypothetical protein